MSRITSGQGAPRRPARRRRFRSSRPRSRPCGPPPTPSGIALERVLDAAGRSESRGDPEPPAAGGLEPALQRDQVHARRTARCTSSLERVELRTSRSACATPASASRPSSCRTCSSASARPTPRPPARTAASASACAIVKHLVELHGGSVRRRERRRRTRARRSSCTLPLPLVDPCVERGDACVRIADRRADIRARPAGLRSWSSTTRRRARAGRARAHATAARSCSRPAAGRRSRRRARAAARAGQRHRHARRGRLRAEPAADP